MNSKLWYLIISLLIIALLVVGCLSIFNNQGEDMGVNRGEDQTKIREEFPVQGMMAISYSYYDRDGIYQDEFGGDIAEIVIANAKNLGANYLFVRATYNSNIQGTIEGNEQDLKIGLKNFIEVAHREGIGIMLSPYIESGNHIGAMEPKYPMIEPEVWTPVALTWARFCQDNNVEIYAPGVEMNIVIKQDKVGQWFKDILPQIRRVYDGQIATNEHFDIERWKILDQAGSFKGYDYLGMTVFPRKTYLDSEEGDIRSLADYRSYIEKQAKIMSNLAKKHRVDKLLVSPVGMDFWKSTITFVGGEIPIDIRAEAYSQALDIFKKYKFDAVFLHDEPATNQGVELEKEMADMIKGRWTE